MSNVLLSKLDGRHDHGSLRWGITQCIVESVIVEVSGKSGGSNLEMLYSAHVRQNQYPLYSSLAKELVKNRGV